MQTINLQAYRAMLAQFPVLEAANRLHRLAGAGIHPFGPVARAQRLAALREPLIQIGWPARRTSVAPPEAA